MTQVPVPTGAAVLSYLGWPADSELSAQADAHAASAVALAYGHTRGNGFTVQATSGTGWTCSPDIAAVIVRACARSLSNPTSAVRTEAGQWSEVGGNFLGWSLVERMTLDSYRRKAA